jgi:hypothetical protein
VEAVQPETLAVQVLLRQPVVEKYSALVPEIVTLQGTGGHWLLVALVE